MILVHLQEQQKLAAMVVQQVVCMHVEVSPSFMYFKASFLKALFNYLLMHFYLRLHHACACIYWCDGYVRDGKLLAGGDGNDSRQPQTPCRQRGPVHVGRARMVEPRGHAEDAGPPLPQANLFTAILLGQRECRS